MTALTDRLPPFDADAEEAVIAAAMVDEQAAYECAAACKPSHFFREQNGTVFAAVIDLLGRGETVNQITVAHLLAQRGQLEGVGGQAYLHDVIRRLPTAIGARYYAELVRETAARRALISAASRIADYAHDRTEELGSILARTEELLMRARGQGEPQARTAADIADEVIAEVQAFMAAPRAMRGLPLPWPRMNHRLGGLVAKRLVTVGAATSIGKSLFLQNIAADLVRQGHPLLVFTTEMSRLQWQLRLVYLLSDFDPEEARRWGHVPEERRREVEAVAIDSASWPVVYVEGSRSVADIASEVRRAKALYGVPGFMVDHFGDVEARGREERERLQAAAKALKDLVMQEDLWCLMSSHVNREASKPRTDRDGNERGEWVQRRHLYGSSAIEKYSDQVICLTPTDPAHLPLTDRQVAEQGGVEHLVCDIGKNRFGRTGRVPLRTFWGSGGGRMREHNPQAQEGAA